MQREIRIYMPNIVDTKQVEALKSNKPFLMRADVPKTATFLGVTSIPSIVDMLGFSGGGGPPGYAYSVDPEETETRKAIFAAVMPNKQLPKLETGMIAYIPLGVAQSVGILYGHFILHGPAVEDGTVEKLVGDEGLIIDMITYEPPPMLRTLYHPKLQEALGGTAKDASDSR